MKKTVPYIRRGLLGAVVVFFFLLALDPSGSSALPSGEGAPVIASIELAGFRSTKPVVIRNLLGIREGEILDARSLRRGLRRVFLTGRFESLRVDRVPGDGGVHLRVVAEEKIRIEEIVVEGNLNVKTSRITGVFPLKRWSFFREEELAPAVESLRKQFRLFGYPRAKVVADRVAGETGAGVKIVIMVEEGFPDRVRSITVNGTDEPGNALLRVFLQTGDVLDQAKIVADEKRLAAYLRGRDYLQVQVTHTVDDEGRLVFRAETGPRVRVEFEGNEKYRDRILREELFLVETTGLGEDNIEEAARRIVRFYQREGFPFVGVATEFERTEGLFRVRFYVHEGVRTTVKDVEITGGSEHEEALRAVLAVKKGVPFSRSMLDGDHDRLALVLNRLGFLSPTVEVAEPRFSEDGTTVRVHYHVKLGLRSWVREIRTEGMNAFPPETTLLELGLEEGQPYDEVKAIDVRYRLLDRYLQAGFNEASVEHRTLLTPDDEWATLVFTVNEGTRQRFGKVIIRGNRRTREAFILQELGIKEGALFNPSLLPLGKRALYQVGIFSEVQVETVGNEPGFRDVLVTVREGKPGTVEFAFGYGDYDRLRTGAQISYRNIGGVNRTFSLRGNYGSQERRVVFTFKDPWILRKWKLALRSQLLIERTERVNADTRDTEWKQKRIAVSATVDRDFSEHLKGSLGYQYSFQDTFDVSPDAVLTPEDEGTVGISSVSVSLVRDTRDNPFDPTAGSVTGAVLETASKFIISETDFVKLTLQHSRFYKHLYSIVSAVSIRAGVAEGLFDTNELPITERFFLGGRTTVRGYEQWELGPKGEVDGDPTGGNAFVNLNLELRIPVWRDLGVVAFVDGGNVWLEASGIDPTDLKFTTGGGVRYKTPVGPVRVDYGYKLEREEGESEGELHFSLGHAF